MKYFIVFNSVHGCIRFSIHPAITSWLQNTSETGKYYISGNPTLIDNNTLVNCQK